MPPRRTLRFSLTSWTLLACVAGLVGGRLLAGLPPSWEGWVLLAGLRGLARVALATGKCLAAPLIFASIVTGADGLEPMRGVARLAWKTGAWIAASSGVAALIGLGVGMICRPAPLGSSPLGGLISNSHGLGGETWIALVFVALAIGIYRNQIEESRARMLLRLSLAVNETLTLLLEWAARMVPLAVFCVALSSAAGISGDLPWGSPSWRRLLGALAAGWAIYALLLAVFLWVLARLHPGRYFLAVGPAVGAGLAGGSPPEVFALTLDRVRTHAGVSNRVGGLTLAACAAWLRDGQVLGWTLLASWPLDPHDDELVLAAGAVIVLGGNALSIFSQTCAAAVIAHSEGETNLLPVRTPQPLADVLLEPSMR